VTTLVFDNTPLSHFARASRLSELESVVCADECVTPGFVVEEIARGIAEYPSLDLVTGLPWLHTVEISEFAELTAFARYKGELGGGPNRNNGEAAVLAWTSVNGGVAIIDEEVARGAGTRDGIEVHGSLWLVVRGFRRGVLGRATAEAVVDDLVASGMRLPIDNGASLFAWAYQEQLLP